jgi:hypothetical protein
MSRVKEELAPQDYEISPRLITRFERKFIPEPNSGCWLWTDAVTAKGYGRILVGNKSRIASRVSHYIYKGTIPTGLLVCHTCDTPSCVNPDHLWLGSAADNMKDCSDKGRFSNQRVNYCKSGHTFDDENTYRQSNGGRGCRICQRASVRKHRAKAKQYAVVGHAR